MKHGLRRENRITGFIENRTDWIDNYGNSRRIRIQGPASGDDVVPLPIAVAAGSAATHVAFEYGYQRLRGDRAST